jgi:hypothetical protein
MANEKLSRTYVGFGSKRYAAWHTCHHEYAARDIPTPAPMKGDEAHCCCYGFQEWAIAGQPTSRLTVFEKIGGVKISREDCPLWDQE